MDIKHYKLPWKIKFENNQYHVITDEVLPWIVCTTAECLPGDQDGSATAMFICETHNALLEAKASAHFEPQKQEENND